MNIYETIAKVMSEINPIAKGKTNSQQGFKYRGIDDVMNEIQPILAKNKLFIVPEIISHIREERTSKNGGNLLYSICTIKYTFYAEDGSFVVSSVIGEAMDSADKATNKAMAVAFKYACFQVFCIPTEEMKDPDGESRNVTPKTNKEIANEELAKLKNKTGSTGDKPKTEALPKNEQERIVNAIKEKFPDNPKEFLNDRWNEVLTAFEVKRWQELKLSQMSDILKFIEGMLPF